MAINQEDGNLSSSPRVTKIRPYSDIDLTFGARTATDGDVFRKTDAAMAQQMDLANLSARQQTAIFEAQSVVQYK